MVVPQFLGIGKVTIGKALATLKEGIRHVPLPKALAEGLLNS